jgi:hypothetical protein
MMASAAEGHPAVANIPNAVKTDSNNSVKIATPDLILQDQEVMSYEVMTDLIFENIGGHELITISRHDLVNGQKVIYSPIKNLTDLYLQYNPNNVLRLQSSDSFLRSLSLSLEDYIPVCGNGYDLVNGVKVPNCKSVYIDPITGDLVINLINIKEGVQAEVQVLTAAEVFDDTIYSGGN